ncbi:MAG: metallophosphatase family protein [Anaerolineae bacterium]|nr:metallophosphatase family protein [Anaerolineae bacterium]
MTRLAILTDIHANLPALEAVIEDMKAFTPDHVIAAGDLVNIGPFSAQVMERITGLKWAAIRGNHEFYLLDYGTARQPVSWKNWTLPPWLQAQLKNWHSYIAAMPDELTLYYRDAPPIRIVHGLPGTPWKAIDPLTPEAQIREWLNDVQETTYVAGHYHLAFERQLDPWHILNPGSLGVPLDGIPKANYLILDGNTNGWKATFRRVEYDIEAVLTEFRRQRFVEKYGAVAYTIVLQFTTARPTINAFLRWHDDHYVGQEMTIAQVDEFLHSGTLWNYLPPAYRVNENQVFSMTSLSRSF